MRYSGGDSVRMKTSYRVNLTEEKETLLITLQAKALDSRSKRTILNDQKADKIVQMIDYDFEKIERFGNDIMVLRAKQLDVWLQEFLERNQSAIVLNLGCGLDTRVSRIGVPPNVLWFDVDYPDVIELRKHFFSPEVGYEMLSSAVTEFRWLEHVPRDRPVMVVAEGLLEYLTEDEVRMLLNQLTNYFPSGRIAFDVMNAFAIKSGKEQLKETTGAVHKWIVRDLGDVDKLDMKLHRISSMAVFTSKYVNKLPLKVRLMYGALSLIPSFRNMLRVLLYEF
jgi:O-methyltransferase involved in polyketide biosynthesis